MADQKKRKLCKFGGQAKSHEVDPVNAQTFTAPLQLQQMLEKKRRELLLMLGPKCDSFSIEGHSVPHKKNSLHKLAAPVQKDPDSPVKKTKKPIRKMIVREESPEVEPFPTLAQVSKKTQETHPLRDSPATPTKRAFCKNSTTEESPEANLPPT